jgi:hypothetical protein
MLELGYLVIKRRWLDCLKSTPLMLLIGNSPLFPILEKTGPNLRTIENVFQTVALRVVFSVFVIIKKSRFYVEFLAHFSRINEPVLKVIDI